MRQLPPEETYCAPGIYRAQMGLPFRERYKLTPKTVRVRGYVVVVAEAKRGDGCSYQPDWLFKGDPKLDRSLKTRRTKKPSPLNKIAEKWKDKETFATPPKRKR